MGMHQVQSNLENAFMTSTVAAFRTPEGLGFGMGTTVGNGIEGWAPGAIFIDTDASQGSQVYVNTGTKATATWTEIADAGVAGGFAMTGQMTLTDAASILFGTSGDIKLVWDGTSLNLAPPSGFWADCPLVGYAGGHAQAFEFFDDFVEFSVGDATSRWTLSTTQGTAILGSAQASNTPGAGGYVSIGTGGTAQYDYATIKLASTNTGAPFKITKDSGKKLWYECRIMVSSITDVNMMIGLFNEDVTDCSNDSDGVESVQDGVYHRTLVATETEIDFGVNQDGTETEVKSNGGTLAANTAIVLGFKFDGASTLTSYVNGAAQATTSEVDATNFPSDQGLTPAFHIKDAESGGQTKRMYIDYVKCVQLR